MDNTSLKLFFFLGLTEGEISTLLDDIDPNNSEFELDSSEDDFEPNMPDEGEDSSSWDSSDDEALSQLQQTIVAGGSPQQQQSYRHTDM